MFFLSEKLTQLDTDTQISSFTFFLQVRNVRFSSLISNQSTTGVMFLSGESRGEETILLLYFWVMECTCALCTVSIYILKSQIHHLYGLCSINKTFPETQLTMAIYHEKVMRLYSTHLEIDIRCSFRFTTSVTSTGFFCCLRRQRQDQRMRCAHAEQGSLFLLESAVLSVT